MQSDAAGNAADAQTQAGRDAINAQLAMYNQNRADTMPYHTTGVGALNMLAGMYGLPTQTGGTGTGGITVTGGDPVPGKKRSTFDKFTDPLNIAKQFGGTSYDPMGLFSSGGGGGKTPLKFNIDSGGGGGTGGGTSNPGTGVADFSQFYQTPDYLVARGEALQGLDRTAAARGGFSPQGFGGKIDADRMRLASNIGSSAFGNFQNSLFKLAGFGGQANQQLNALGQNTAGQVGNQFNNMGQARASGYMNQANAWGNALNGIGTAAGQYWGNSGGGTNSFQNNPSYIGPVVKQPITG
jgi:hypothetical protein